MATSLREALGYSSELAEFFRHLPGKHDQKTHGRPAGGWKPSMTRVEAEEWVQGSAVTGDLYHVTHAGDAIRDEGFLPSKVGHAGRGVYVTETPQDAKQWENYQSFGQGDRSGPRETVVLKTKVDRVAEWDDAPGSPSAIAGDIALVDALDGGMPKPPHLSDQFISDARSSKSWADDRGYTDILRNVDAQQVSGESFAEAVSFQGAGFDAVRVSFSGSSSSPKVSDWQSVAGGNQLLVFDPERVVAING